MSEPDRGAWFDRFISPEIRAKAARLDHDVGPLGVDPFGFEPSSIRYAAAPMAWLYRSYFRCVTQGIENVPDGRVLLVSNHSGQLPFDGLMIACAMILEREPPRMVRSMVERWVPRLPYVSIALARLGQVVGTPENCRRLLAHEEAILVFPEGVRGLSKTFDRRYRLARFGTGFMRLALEMNTPIVPVSVVGAEEQAPAMVNLQGLARALGMPALPITPTFPLLGPVGLLPLPTRYRITFGAAMNFLGSGHEEDAVIRPYIEQVRATVQDLVDRSLADRQGVFV
ncbi:MAG: lysophospholipid acyltransferase family protein [Myxococcota bacterium]